tara:strand:- start:43097 stop:43921 length:825 start_codon:yes stop_codon:yes gene_type:complete
MKVLIPTDFSDSARVAFDYAYQFSRNFEDVEFVMLNSYEMPSSGSAGGVMMSLEEAMHEESKNDLKREVNRLKKEYTDLNLITVSRYGNLENCVHRTVNEKGIDFVIMGTHGASGWKKALIGSNTEKVIENVDVPIIAVPKDWKYRPVNNIVYATDLKRLQHPDALKPVCQIAEHFDSTVHIVYVAKNASQVDLEQEVSKLPLNDYFSKRKRKFEVIESENVEFGIDTYVKDSNADMVVLIPKVATFWQSIFKRSVTEQMCFHTRVPLLVIKDK